MSITVIRQKQDTKTKMIAVWSPTAAGKTMIAVNLAALMSEIGPTALVDLTADNAVFTWVNCSKTEGLEELIKGNPEEAFYPLHMPKLRVYTKEPDSQNVSFNGEAAILNGIVRALHDHNIVIDAPREYLKAANILAVANISILIADQNIHGSLILQKHITKIRNPVLVVNRFREDCPALADPATVLKKEAVLYIPDRPQPVLESILVGQPVAAKDEEFKTLFSKLLEKLEG